MYLLPLKFFIKSQLFCWKFIIFLHIAAKKKLKDSRDITTTLIDIMSMRYTIHDRDLTLILKRPNDIFAKWYNNICKHMYVHTFNIQLKIICI